MALKDRFRRAIGRDSTSDRESISSGSTGSTGQNTPTGTMTPTSNYTSDSIAPLSAVRTVTDPSKPTITLTKTHSRLSLSKTLTWGSSSGDKKSKAEAAKEKKLKQWAKSDHVEWTTPRDRRPTTRKDINCQNTLRAWELSMALGERSRSICSGVSPGQSRACSIDEGALSIHSVAPGKLSQEVAR